MKKVTEQLIKKRVQQEESFRKCTLWVNNSGCFLDKRDVPVRFGLGNISKKANDFMKSSDLIGIRKLTITQEMVGKTIGQFVAREVKKSTWKYKGTAHEIAQKNFIDYINQFGGDAAFTTGEADNEIH